MPWLARVSVPFLSLALLAAPLLAAGRPRAVGSLQFGGQSLPVLTADVGIYVELNRYDEATDTSSYDPEHGEVVYWLEALVPELGRKPIAIGFLPVARANGGRQPSLQALATLAMEEQPNEHWVASLAKHGGEPVRENRVEFRGWNERRLKVAWRGQVVRGEQRLPLVLEAEAEFAGLDITVERRADVARYLRKYWDAQPLDTLKPHVMVDNPAQYSAVYVPKGWPLPNFWRRAVARAYVP